MSLRDVRAAHIALAARSSPATFCVYFDAFRMPCSPSHGRQRGRAGGRGFERVREQSICALLVAIAALIDACGAGDADAPANAQAGILAAMLVRLSAIYQGDRTSELLTGDELVEGAALRLAERVGERL